MKVPFHLVVNKSGSVKTCKNRPNLNWDEVSILVNLELPDMLFKKPQIQAEIKIPDDAAVPQIVDAETSNAIKQSIEGITGYDVKITIVNPDA